ncbi:MAG TPA: hypothetical protein VG963_16095, partial [Polyangiaceae bacterium]|nr:hypothetical protein [Polyangiaceae bacterium]
DPRPSAPLRIVGLCLIGALSLSTVQPVHADDSVPTCAAGAEPSDQEVGERLSWIERRLRAGAPYAMAWWGGWLGFATGEAVYSWLRFADTRDRLDRDVWLVSGVGSILWVGQLLLFPMRAAYAPLRMRRLPRGTPAERRASLAKAEELLASAAKAERESLHWSEHVLDMAWAVGSSAYILGRNWRHEPHARVLKVTGVEFILTVLLSEAPILSTPRKAMRDLGRYHEAGCGDARTASRRAPHAVQAPSWQLGLAGTGLSLTLRF